MEGVDHQINIGNSGPGSGRWNPTKEQISMLENLYKQGLRTPTAQQIQQITARLQAFGHIEGKNVFYWFQNHKARQRQKQKLEHNNNLAFNFNRFLLNKPPIFAPYTQNAPCYIPPQTELGLYQHYPKVPPPEAAGYKRRLIPESMDPSYERHNKAMQQPKRSNEGHDHQETLDLFPMHPTGILQAKNSSSSTTTTTSTSSSDQNGGNYNSDHHDVFNFFYGKLN